MREGSAKTTLVDSCPRNIRVVHEDRGYARSEVDKSGHRRIDRGLVRLRPHRDIDLIPPNTLLMVIAGEDLITPTELEKKAFDRAKWPAKLVVVQGRHFDAYQTPDFAEFSTPAVQWFKQWLMK